MSEFIRPGDEDFEKILRDFGIPIQTVYGIYRGYYLPRTGVKLLRSIEGITRNGELQIRRVGSGNRSVGILRTIKLIDFLKKNMHNQEYNYRNTNIRRKRSKSKSKSRRRSKSRSKSKRMKR